MNPATCRGPCRRPPDVWQHHHSAWQCHAAQLLLEGLIRRASLLPGGDPVRRGRDVWHLAERRRSCRWAWLPRRCQAMLSVHGRSPCMARRIPERQLGQPEQLPDVSDILEHDAEWVRCTCVLDGHALRLGTVLSAAEQLADSTAVCQQPGLERSHPCAHLTCPTTD